MQHFKVVQRSISSVVSEFPRSPGSDPGSIQEYLETELADGWEFVSLDGANFVWFFKATGRNS